MFPIQTLMPAYSIVQKCRCGSWTQHRHAWGGEQWTHSVMFAWQITASRFDHDRPQPQCAECQQLDTKECMLCDPLMWNSRTDRTNWRKADEGLPGAECMVALETESKGAWETFWDGGNATCLDCGGGYMDVYLRENLFNCSLDTGAFYLMQIIPQSWFFLKGKVEVLSEKREPG